MTVDFELASRYRAGAGPVLLTGVQAIARLLVEQHAADAAAGLRTGVVRLRLPGQPARRARPDPGPGHRAARRRRAHPGPGDQRGAGRDRGVGQPGRGARAPADRRRRDRRLVRQGPRRRPGRRPDPARQHVRRAPARAGCWCWPATTRVGGDQLAEQVLRVLRGGARVERAAAVAEPEVEPVVRAERELAAVVVLLGLVDHQQLAVWARLDRVVATRVELRHAGVAAAVGPVQEQPAARGEVGVNAIPSSPCPRLSGPGRRGRAASSGGRRRS